MTSSSPPRIGLVMGAGGIIGASYLAGALEGIRCATGWEPKHAEVVLGTSAGGFIGALSAVGIPPALTYMRCTGDVVPGEAFPPALVELSARMDQANEGHWLRRYRPPVRVPRPLLSSPRLASRALRGDGGLRFPQLVIGLLGEGMLSTIPSFGGVIRAALPEGWPDAPLRVVACDLDTGRRVVFGAPGQPRPDLHLAVSASTAIPGLFAPVTLDGARYCDAGFYSPSNLDLVAGMGLDVIVCINPFSGADVPSGRGSGARGPRRSIFGHVGRLARGHCEGLLAVERQEVERSGSAVYVLSPTVDEIAHYPANPMDLGARPAVMRRARATIIDRFTHDKANEELAALLRLSVGSGPRQPVQDPAWHA